MNDRFQHRTCVMTVLLIAVCAVLFFSACNAAAQERGRSQYVTASIDCSVVPTLLHYPVYRIPLRVHLGESGRSPAEFKVILEEINDIWLSQAGICFEMQISLDDEPLEQGMSISVLRTPARGHWPEWLFSRRAQYPGTGHARPGTCCEFRASSRLRARQRMSAVMVCLSITARIRMTI